MSRVNVTPTQALSRLLAAAKQINADECKDERVFQALQGEIGVAEGVLRDYVEPDHRATVLHIQAALGYTDSGWISPDVILMHIRQLKAAFVPHIPYDAVELPLPEPASKWFGFPFSKTDYFTKAQLIRCIREIQLSTSTPVAAQSAVAAAKFTIQQVADRIGGTSAMSPKEHRTLLNGDAVPFTLVQITYIANLFIKDMVLQGLSDFGQLQDAAPLHEAGNAAAVKADMSAAITWNAALDAAQHGLRSRVDSDEIFVSTAIEAIEDLKKSAAPSIAAPTEVERDAARYKMALHKIRFCTAGHAGPIMRGIAIEALDAAIATGETK